MKRYQVQYRCLDPYACDWGGRPPSATWAPAICGPLNTNGAGDAFASTFDSRGEAERIAAQVQEDLERGETRIIEVEVQQPS